MYKISLFALCLVAVLAEMTKTPKTRFDITKAQDHFDKFVKDYNRVYKNEDDKKLHYEAFVKNLQLINEMNEKSSSATFGINKFADYTAEESRFMHGLRLPEH